MPTAQCTRQDESGNHRTMSDHKIALVFAAALLLLAACSSHPSALPVEAPRLYVFDCGTIDVADVSLFHPGIGKGEHKRLANACYLVAHPKGTLLWDAGLPDALAQTPEGKTMFNVFTARVSRGLATQLAEINVDPARINYLGISHMHFDHIGNSALMPNATLLIQKVEYDAAFGAEPGRYGFDPTGYSHLKTQRTKKLDGDYDVFGDGRVVIKRAPGHTPGHQALFLRLPKTGNILLSGDLVHFTDNWTHKRVPDFNFDKAQSAKTLDETDRFLKENDATLWIQHDFEQNAGLKHAPAYYE